MLNNAFQANRAHLPTVHFVWIGPPEFDLGGHDTIAAETITANFKHFAKPEDQRNPMIFWCQEAHVKQYEEYFLLRDVDIQVKAVEPYLQALSVGVAVGAGAKINKHAAAVWDIYQELHAVERNQKVDRVCFKDLFSLFLQAYEGGYFMDTNLWASMEFEVALTPANTHQMPWLPQAGGAPEIPEVYLQYTPQHDHSHAMAALQHYLRRYRQIFNADAATVEIYSAEHHRAIGNLITYALCLVDNYDDIFSVDHQHCTWSHVEQASGYEVVQLRLTKEYYNSHCFDKDDRVPPAHSHALLSLVSRLDYDLSHGIHPDTLASFRGELANGCYRRIESIPLIATVLLELADEADHERHQQHLQCLQLLLERGARLDIQYREQTFRPNNKLIAQLTCSPLLLAILKQSDAALSLMREYLLKKSKAECRAVINQVIQGKSLLTWAVEYGAGATELLELGADANLVGPQQAWPPLVYAVVKGNEVLAKALLQKGADVDVQVISSDSDGDLYAVTPLHLALQMQDSALVTLLLSYKADPTQPLIPQSKENQASVVDMLDIVVDESCRNLILQARQQCQNSSRHCHV